MLVGLSLSQCVADILRGDVKEEDVSAIISGTCARDASDWEYLMSSYASNAWKEWPQQRSVDLVRRLIDTRRLVQPRMNGQQPPNISGGTRWIDTSNATYFAGLPR